MNFKYLRVFYSTVYCIEVLNRQRFVRFLLHILVRRVFPVMAWFGEWSYAVGGVTYCG